MKYCCKEFEAEATPGTLTLTDGRVLDNWSKPSLRLSDGQWAFFYNCCYGECPEKTHALSTLKFCPFCGSALGKGADHG